MRSAYDRFNDSRCQASPLRDGPTRDAQTAGRIEPVHFRRRPAPRAAQEFRHEVGFYASDEEFRDLIVPFALSGVEAGEPVVFAYDEPKMALLKRWLADTPTVSYITDTGPYATPGKALGSWRTVVEEHLAAGASRVRIAGNVPHPGYGVPYAGWDRYEAALDLALGDLPVWAPCLYDLRVTPDEVVQTATRLHHHVLDRTGARRVNTAYQDVWTAADFLRAPSDPLEHTSPDIELCDPTPGRTRDAVRHLLAEHSSDAQTEVLVLAASEILTNALVHGQSPTVVRMWRADGRVVIHIRDGGQGPVDPLAGLVADVEGWSESGRGLWITHQLDVDVALLVDDDGFTVRLRTELIG